MSATYLHRLIVIGDKLESHYPPTVQDGLGMLQELLEQNCDDPEFVQAVKDLLPPSSDVRSQLLDMVERSQRKRNQPALATSSPVEPIMKQTPQPPPKIFISYAHKDERYKNDLVTILTPLQNQGILEIWQDRQIEEGAEWYQAIQDAMNACDLALLLVSKYFLASGFIGKEELPKLLQRRKKQGLRVIPIIISECVWQSVPVLKDLQAFPRDGKPMASFRSSGDRDKAWTEIAKVVEKFSRRP